MNKKALSERDICTQFITPAVVAAGWDLQRQVRGEVTFTKGRIIVRGKLHTRGQAIVGFRVIPPMVPAFVCLYLCEGAFLQRIELIGTAGQDNISVTKSKHLPIPVPPLEEQRRIVAKVTELLALCDQLKARIAAARAKHARLAEALVAQAVAA